MSKGEQALNFLMSLNQKDESGYASMIKDDIGPELIMVFEKYCKGIAPEADVTIVNTLVHLMITGYLVKNNEAGAAPKIII